MSRVTELASYLLLNMLQPDRDLVPEAVRHRAVGCQVRAARIGRDRESRGNREPQPRHLGKVGPLATKEGSLSGRALSKLPRPASHIPLRTHDDQATADVSVLQSGNCERPDERE